MRGSRPAVRVLLVLVCVAVGVVVLAPVLRPHVGVGWRDIGTVSWIAAGAGALCVAVLGLGRHRKRPLPSRSPAAVPRVRTDGADRGPSTREPGLSSGADTQTSHCIEHAARR